MVLMPLAQALEGLGRHDFLEIQVIGSRLHELHNMADVLAHAVELRLVCNGRAHLIEQSEQCGIQFLMHRLNDLVLRGLEGCGHYSQSLLPRLAKAKRCPEHQSRIQHSGCSDGRLVASLEVNLGEESPTTKLTAMFAMPLETAIWKIKKQIHFVVVFTNT